MKYDYGYPGDGAVEYARQFIEGKSYIEALRAIRWLLQAETTDPRIKRCEYCGYPYRDKTRPNNSVTCCRQCKVSWDTLRRAEVKRSKRKPTPRDYGYPEGYQFWHEYPFWTYHDKMDNYITRHEKPMEYEKIEKISTLQATYGLHNRRKPKYNPKYTYEQAGRK